MTRPVTLEEYPVFYPHTCIRCGCGLGADGRLFLIGLGIELTEKFNPMYDGEIYYCNLCAKNLITDLQNLFTKWDADHSPWESPDRAESSYSWKNAIDLSGIEAEIGRTSTDVDSRPDTDDSSTESDSLGAVESDSTVEGTDEVPDGTVPNVSSGTSLNTRFGVLEFE